MTRNRSRYAVRLDLDRDQLFDLTWPLKWEMRLSRRVGLSPRDLEPDSDAMRDRRKKAYLLGEVRRAELRAKGVRVPARRRAPNREGWLRPMWWRTGNGLRCPHCGESMTTPRHDVATVGGYLFTVCNREAAADV